jgi:hypothetical protein
MELQKSADNKQAMHSADGVSCKPAADTSSAPALSTARSSFCAPAEPAVRKPAPAEVRRLTRRSAALQAISPSCAASAAQQALPINAATPKALGLALLAVKVLPEQADAFGKHAGHWVADETIVQVMEAICSEEAAAYTYGTERFEVGDDNISNVIRVNEVLQRCMHKANALLALGQLTQLRASVEHPKRLSLALDGVYTPC